jgi:2-polyprenyl-3-methyl-5-hydroxy-6-metoxy-1,4-benzoquinol methylase
MALKQMAADQWREPSSFDDIFEAEADPWKSNTSSEQERFAVTLSVLEASRRARFASAVELGCAEGIFTQRLAPMCDAILGLDFSEIALERAKKRLPGNAGVTFRHWDMRNEALTGKYELVVAMGVITSLYRPGDVRRMCNALVDAIEPNGFLLFSDVRQSRVFEDAWWGRFVLRGGEQIRRLLSRDARLDLVASDDTASHVFALYRRNA